MNTENFSSVQGLLDVILDDDDIKDQIRKKSEESKLSRALQLLRIESGLTQEDMAQKMGCKQARISKLENGPDSNVKFSDVQAYAQAAGHTVNLQFVKRQTTLVDEIKQHAFAIHSCLSQLAELALKDEDIARGVVHTFSETLYNQTKLLQTAASKLPLNPDTGEPYFRVNIGFRQVNHGGLEADPCASIAEEHGSRT